MKMLRCPLTVAALVVLSVCVPAQSTASIEGLVTDQNGDLIAGAEIMARSRAIGVARRSITDNSGRSQIAALPIGDYQLQISAQGFTAQVVENFRIEVGRRITQDFQLRVGNVSGQVAIASTNNEIERSSISVSQVVDRRMVQEIPLNGRYFLDLGLLVPGSVTPPQGAFSAAPMRGLGALAINTAGNREETVNYLVNGITLNNLTFSSISFQPSINTIQEFKVDNSTFSAEYGQSGGAVVNLATRSGSNEFHGEVFELLRNDALDARNFFELTSQHPASFKRNQFGGNLGGPILKKKL